MGVGRLSGRKYDKREKPKREEDWSPNWWTCEGHVKHRNGWQIDMGQVGLVRSTITPYNIGRVLKSTKTTG